MERRSSPFPRGLEPAAVTCPAVSRAHDTESSPVKTKTFYPLSQCTVLRSQCYISVEGRIVKWSVLFVTIGHTSKRRPNVVTTVQSDVAWATLIHTFLVNNNRKYDDKTRWNLILTFAVHASCRSLGDCQHDSLRPSRFLHLMFLISPAPT